MISPSFAEPPVPQNDFNFFPRSSRSSCLPIKPSTSVTALPARCLVSNLTFSFCCAGNNVSPECRSSSNLKFGSVLNTNPRLSGLFFLLMYSGFQMFKRFNKFQKLNQTFQPLEPLELFKLKL